MMMSSVTNALTSASRRMRRRLFTRRRLLLQKPEFVRAISGHDPLNSIGTSAVRVFRRKSPADEGQSHPRAALHLPHTHDVALANALADSHRSRLCRFVYACELFHCRQCLRPQNIKALDGEVRALFGVRIVTKPTA